MIGNSELVLFIDGLAERKILEGTAQSLALFLAFKSFLV